MFLAVWWVWVYTTWITNWLDPERTPVRLLLFLLMLGGLVLSMSIPTAFEGRGLWFATAYAAMQVGRTLFWFASIPAARVAARLNALRILAWLSCSAIFWILGALAQGEGRLGLWALALAIEYVSPVARFWIPKYGASSIEDWFVEGGHMAERCAGFIIIALGEAIVVNGATFADLSWTAHAIVAFVSAFVASIAMWWIYFHRGAEAGSELIAKSTESGRLARSAYTYLHLPIVAGIVLTAVADEVVLTHPDRSYRPEDRAVCDRRTSAVSSGNDPVQARHSRLAAAFARRGHRRAARARLFCSRSVTPGAVADDDRDPHRRGGVGNRVAAGEDGIVCGTCVRF